MMSTPPPLLLYIYYFLVVVLFFYLVKRLGKKSTHNYDTTTTATKNPIQLRSSNRLIYEFFFKKVLCKDNPFTPSLKLQVPINIPPNIVCLFLFASASTYKSGTDTTLLYLQ